MKRSPIFLLVLLSFVFAASQASLAQPQTPVITVQPVDQSVNAGETATFTVAATCDDPIGYQWWRIPYISYAESKIVNIPGKIEGATSNQLRILSTTSEDDSTQYLCEVYNTVDHTSLWVNSSTATLNVYTPLSAIIVIPDDIVRSLLINHDIDHGTSYAITDNFDGTIFVPDLAIVDTILLEPHSNRDINTLQGIEQFTYLSYLSLNTLGGGLLFENHPNIRKIEIKFDSGINELSMINCPRFEMVILRQSNINNLTISDCQLFNKLYIDTAPPVGGVGNLLITNCDKIEEFRVPTEGGIGNIEVSDCSNFQRIGIDEYSYAGNIQITNCPKFSSINSLSSVSNVIITNCPNLSSLYFNTSVSRNEGISELTIIGEHNLESLSIGSSPTFFSTNDFEFSKYPELKNLDLFPDFSYRNSMTELDLSKNFLLETLDCSNNYIPIVYISESFTASVTKDPFTQLAILRSTSSNPSISASQTGAFELGSTGAIVNMITNNSGAGSLTGSAPTNPTIVPPLPSGIEHIREDRYWVINENGLTDFEYNLILDLSTMDSLNVDSCEVLYRPNNTSPWVRVTEFGVTVETVAHFKIINGLPVFGQFAISGYHPYDGSWSTDLLLGDSGNNNTALSFGLHTSATDGVDTDLGEEALPPLPPSGVMDARFILPIEPVEASLKDFRNASLTTATWSCSFQPGTGGYPITFSWSPASLPTGYFTLKDAITGAIVNVNMKTQNNYVLTNTGITSLLIEYNDKLCFDADVVDNWNILSVPVLTDDMSKDILFPTSTSNAFGFNGGYITTNTLENGKGYWLRFDTADTIEICGDIVSSPIIVNEDWNMVGVYNNNIDTTNIIYTPSGIRSSYYFGYENGYKVEDTLKVGKGYWVKVKQAGELDIINGLGKRTTEPIAQNENDWGKIIITDNKGKEVVLYASTEIKNADKFELPPIPPTGIYDVRYQSGKILEDISKNSKDIKISSADYPVTIKVNGIEATIKDKIGGRIVNKVLRNGEALIIYNKGITTIEILGKVLSESQLPMEYTLYQNYPNPFNPTTKIKFALPNNELVMLDVYNILGEKVKTLLQQNMEAGYHEIEFNAENLSSGIYLYRINAGSFNSVKKMVILK